MADNNDYYKVLGVSREASDDQIRKAYKKLARENHPDMRPNDKDAADRFKRVQEAYSVLGDTEKREQYDRYGAAFQGAGRGPRGQTYTWSTGPGGAGPVDIEELFGGQIDLGDLFGGAFGRGRGAGFRTRTERAPPPRKGEDVRLEIEVPFQVAAEGGQHSLQLQRDGKAERINVKIPPGVAQGSVIRLAGQGQPAATGGGPAGDLLLTVRIAPHPWFRREGSNLLVDVPITPSEAALGAKVEVPTLGEGKVTVTVPSGTSSGTKLRLRGKGVHDPKTHGRGDLFAVIKIVVPKQVSEDARKLFEQLAQAAPQSPRSGLW